MLPPKTQFESPATVRGTESFDLKSFTIYTVNATSGQLRGGAGLLNPITIDMSNVRTESIGGKAPVVDVIREINEALDIAPSRGHTAIGAIRDSVGA